MANFRKRHTRRHVKCTLCTPYKWMGNAKEKTKPKYRLGDGIVPHELFVAELLA
jgi:hypothetical protein